MSLVLAAGAFVASETTGRAPVAVLDACPGAAWAPSWHRMKPIRTKTHEICVQLLPTKPQKVH